MSRFPDPTKQTPYNEMFLQDLIDNHSITTSH
jgi:hypothetical protein